MPVCEVRGLQFKALEAGSVRVRMSTKLGKCTARCKGICYTRELYKVFERPWNVIKLLNIHAKNCHSVRSIKIFTRAREPRICTTHQTSQTSHLAAKKVLLFGGKIYPVIAPLVKTRVFFSRGGNYSPFSGIPQIFFALRTKKRYLKFPNKRSCEEKKFFVFVWR